MKFKCLFPFILFSTVGLISTFAFGAEDNSDSDASSQTVTETSLDENLEETAEGPTAEELSSAEEETSTAIEDTFVPSQQISEDLSVSFPVNI